MSIDCATYREKTGVDPAVLDRECAEHEAACPACAAYAERARALELKLNEALRFDVATVRRAAATARRAPQRRTLHTAGIALAAAIVGGLAVWIVQPSAPRNNPDALVAEVLAHWPLEPDSWVTTQQPVPIATLERVLDPQARVDLDRLGLVTYANLCWVQGRWIPHLVVQGQAGPVMLLLFSSEPVERQLPLALPQQGLHGVVMPLAGGSVAVLGTDAEPLEPLRARVNAAVQWGT
jgi:hypothetical protein